jgi:arylsulfate sulfotransferase
MICLKRRGNFICSNFLSEMSKPILTLVISFGLFTVSSCNSDDGDTTPPIIVSSAKITMAPNPDTPLVGVLELSTDEPTRVRVSLSSSASRVIDFDKFNTNHSLPILGFHPGKKHIIHVIVIDEAGNETSADSNIEVTTDPLPEGFPPIEVLVSKPEKMETGVTLFPVRGGGANADFGNVLVIVDETGEVVWYHKPPAGIGDVRRVSNGNLLFISGGDSIVEMDMLGNVVQKWHPSLTTEGDQDSTQVVTLNFHHEVFEMASRNFLVLSKEDRDIDNYPTSETDPLAPTETALVTGDLVVEFSRDGSILNEWSLLDILDPLRIGYGSLIIFQGDRGKDWSHCNGVIHDPIDDSIIVSCRQQDAVIKFRRSTGELIWILGPHENWDLNEFGEFLLTPTNESEFFWPYHMHAPMITPGGCILLYDNGNFRASPPDEKLPAVENFSRAAEYCIDEASNEITLIWEYGQFAEEILYTPLIGDADLLPTTGNVLITFGGITIDADGNPTDNPGQAKNSVRIIEVTHTTPAEKVFDLKIADDTLELENRWRTYRSERLQSLYPQQ